MPFINSLLDFQASVAASNSQSSNTDPAEPDLYPQLYLNTAPWRPVSSTLSMWVCSCSVSLRHLDDTQETFNNSQSHNFYCHSFYLKCSINYLFIFHSLWLVVFSGALLNSSGPSHYILYLSVQHLPGNHWMFLVFMGGRSMILRISSFGVWLLMYGDLDRVTELLPLFIDAETEIKYIIF